MDLKIDSQFFSPSPSPAPAKINKKDPDLKALREKTREYEAVYINELYKSMRKSIPEGGLFEKDMSSDVFQEMLDLEYARATAKGKGMGLGEAMFNQMKKHIQTKP